MDNNTHPISSPMQAATEVYFKPKAVFNALANVNNWSWFPFFMVTIMLCLPNYLYYQLVDTAWVVDQIARASLPGASPAEIDNFKQLMPAEALGYSTYVIPMVVIVTQAILAAYFTFVTRNDETNVQGFSDWYGATWWIAMPTVVNGILALILLIFQDAGAQFSSAYTMPLSIAFIFGFEMTNPLFNWALNIRLDALWSILLAAYCINSWTSFTIQKSLLLAVIPTALISIVTLIFSL